MKPRAVSLLVLLGVVAIFLIAPGCVTRQAEMQSPRAGRLIEVNGETIHLLDVGPKQESGLPPVVLIHGASVNLLDMKLALGDRLAKTRRVIMVDRPGRGYSTRPDDGYRLESQATLIHDALEAVGVERPVIVGQSFGGAVALSYALKYQSEMRGLVVLAPVSHEWPGGVAWYNNVSGWPVAGQALRRGIIPLYAPLAARRGVEESFAPDIAPEGYYEKSGLMLLFRPKDFRNNAADLRHLKAEIVAMQGRYQELTLPVAILTGADDTTVSPKIHSAALARQIEGASFESLPDTGHALHHSESERVIKAIDEVSGIAGPQDRDQ